MKPKKNTTPARVKKPAPAPLVAGDPASVLETVLLLPTEKVLISERNTRQPTVAQVKKSGLLDSLRTGQLTPCIARPHPTQEGCYELAAGARRRTAAHELGIPLKVIVRDIPDGEFDDLIYTENAQREDPDPIAEAQLIARRLDEGADERQIAARYGKDVIWVKRRAKLIHLSPASVKYWRSDLAHWGVEMIEHIALFSPERQAELLGNYRVRQAGSLAELQKATKAQSCSLDVPWLDNPATFHNGCGPGCQHSSANEGTLLGFGDKKGSCGHCLNPSCFKLRAGLAADAAATALLTKRGINPARVHAAYMRHVTHDGMQAINVGDAAFNVVNLYELNGFDLVPLKKKDKVPDKASLALCLDDPLAPALMILKPRKGSAQAKNLAAKKKAKTDPQEAFAQKAALFQARRWSLVRNRLLAALEKTETAPNVPMPYQVALAAWFGTRSAEDTLTAPAKEFGVTTPWSVRQDTPDGDVGNAIWQQLWDNLRPVLECRLRRIQKVEDFTFGRFHPVPVHDELLGIADLIGFDLFAAKNEVDLTDLPVPKSWPKGLDPHTLEPATPAQ